MTRRPIGSIRVGTRHRRDDLGDIDGLPLSIAVAGLPSVSRKKVTAVFDGGRLSSDNGVMLLALVEVGATSPLRSPL
jgi:hypothetical protein